MVELGLAIAWEKPVFLFRDDFRRCTDSGAYPLNLVLFTGLPEMGWDAYGYRRTACCPDHLRPANPARPRNTLFRTACAITMSGSGSLYASSVRSAP